MITKILYTALVIAIVVTVTRFRARRPVARRPRAPAPPPSRTPRLIAYATAAGIAALAAALYYQRWQEWHEVVTMRVVNSRTGETATYEAYRGTIEGRSFETVDGWRVTVSDAERVEIQHAGR